MRKNKKGIPRNQQTISSLRECFFKYLRTDLSVEQKRNIQGLVDLILDISEKEFECGSCRRKFQLLGFDVTKFLF